MTDIKGLSEEDACQLIEDADNWENFVDTTDDENDDVQDDGKISEQHDETMRPGYETLIILPNVSRDLADALYEKGFCSAEELSLATVEDLTDIKGLSEEDACQLIENADNWEHFIDNTDETDESDDDFQDDLDVEDTLVDENDVGMADESEEMTASDEHEDQKPEDADMTMPEEDVEEPDAKESE